MNKRLPIPDDAEEAEVDMRADDVYLSVELLNGEEELIETHTYAIAPEADDE